MIERNTRCQVTEVVGQVAGDGAEQVAEHLLTKQDADGDARTAPRELKNAPSIMVHSAMRRFASAAGGCSAGGRERGVRATGHAPRICCGIAGRRGGHTGARSWLRLVAEVIGAEETRLYSAAQDEQARVLADGERPGGVRSWAASENVRLVAVARALSVERARRLLCLWE